MCLIVDINETNKLLNRYHQEIFQGISSNVSVDEVCCHQEYHVGYKILLPKLDENNINIGYISPVYEKNYILNNQITSESNYL